MLEQILDTEHVEAVNATIRRLSLKDGLNCRHIAPYC